MRPDEFPTADIAVENQGDGVLRLEGPWAGDSPVMRLEHWRIEGETEWATSEDESDDTRVTRILREGVEVTQGEVPVDLLMRLEEWLHGVSEKKREGAKEAA